MGPFRDCFETLPDPRTGNAPRYDFLELLVTALTRHVERGGILRGFRILRQVEAGETESGREFAINVVPLSASARSKKWATAQQIACQTTIGIFFKTQSGTAMRPLSRASV